MKPVFSYELSLNDDPEMDTHGFLYADDSINAAQQLSDYYGESNISVICLRRYNTPIELPPKVWTEVLDIMDKARITPLKELSKLLMRKEEEKENL